MAESVCSVSLHPVKACCSSEFTAFCDSKDSNSSRESFTFKLRSCSRRFELYWHKVINLIYG